MAEQIYTIPVNDAFDSECECPMCQMQKELERNAIEYTMGPSYMEDDNRAMTDKLGFCSHHLRLLYQEKNRLGLALMMNTHMNKTIKDMKELAAKGPASKAGLFGNMFVRYVDTIFHMWKKDTEFREKFVSSKGFCTYHYGILYKTGQSKLSKEQYSEFINALNKVFFEGMERVNEDISWFIDKFDYRYKNEPWKNSKDSVQRGIIKMGHTFVE